MLDLSTLRALRESLPPALLPDGGFLDALRDSLQAKRERLLQRPLVAELPGGGEAAVPADPFGIGGVFDFVQDDLRRAAPRRSPVWRQADDGTVRLRISIDYDDQWRGLEKEVLSNVRDTVEGCVTLLTPFQRSLLLSSPRELLALQPSPVEVELVAFEVDRVGGSEQVVELVLGELPVGREHATHVAIVPNLVPLNRQLHALEILEKADESGPLAPLRALLGLQSASAVSLSSPDYDPVPVPQGTRLDEYQQVCVHKALQTPHFALIQGPPGSGKTTVISTIVRSTLGLGQRVMVVSPTHVAVDNVVEKLVSDAAEGAGDGLPPRSLPVRYSSKRSKLLPGALPYWVGPSEQHRGATVARRLEESLCELHPVARALYDRVDAQKMGVAPLSVGLAQCRTAICGTPIGILSYDAIKQAEPGSIDLLVVDEVSKMTLPEFLAVAVKARRWVLVGDPQQLPPYNDVEENGVALDSLFSSSLDLVCSVGALLERKRPGDRRDLRLVVVAREPELVARAVRAHLEEVGVREGPPVVVAGDEQPGGIVVCAPGQEERVAEALSPVARLHRGRNPERAGFVQILAERGLRVWHPPVASGARLVEPRCRATAEILGKSFDVFHARPWAERADQGLRVVSFRNGLAKALPSAAAIELCGPEGITRGELLKALAVRFALNAVSVFDLLAGFDSASFDVSPLLELEAVLAPLDGLRKAVGPFVGTLRKQYRMHGSISQVPRELFYFGDALYDGKSSTDQVRVRHVQVARRGPRGEDNPDEAEKVVELLARFSTFGAERGSPHTVLVVTPYRAQEALLGRTIDDARRRGQLDHVEVEVCTLDRCQGREADMVFISLVRSRASVFMDSPKRWNVALTRAQNGLFMFGDIEAYLREAGQARREGHTRRKKPRMSLLARIVESQVRLIEGQEPAVMGVRS